MKLVKYPGTQLGANLSRVPTARSMLEPVLGREREKEELLPLVFSRRYPLVGSLATKYEKSDALIVVFDQTGSMERWPNVFLSNLPDLMSSHEGLGRFSPNYEISWGAVGDARNIQRHVRVTGGSITSTVTRNGVQNTIVGGEAIPGSEFTVKENYPVQLCGFASDINEAHLSLKSLVLEGKGGNNWGESYDLALYGIASRLRTTCPQRGFVVILGDEPYFEHLKPEETKEFFGEPPKFIRISDACAAIRAKGFDIYSILKNNRARPEWCKLLGSQNVSQLERPEKVVEAIIGIMAARMGRANEYLTRLASRTGAEFALSVGNALKELKIEPKGLLE